MQLPKFPIDVQVEESAEHLDFLESSEDMVGVAVGTCVTPMEGALAPVC
jgi:hypothetical protein